MFDNIEKEHIEMLIKKKVAEFKEVLDDIENESVSSIFERLKDDEDFDFMGKNIKSGDKMEKMTPMERAKYTKEAFCKLYVRDIFSYNKMILLIKEEKNLTENDFFELYDMIDNRIRWGNNNNLDLSIRAKMQQHKTYIKALKKYAKIEKKLENQRRERREKRIEEKV